MTHVTCRLTAKIRDQLRNHTLGNRVWATFRLQRTSQHAATRTRLASVRLSVCLSVRRHHQTLTCRACRRSRWYHSHSPLLARPPCCRRTSSLARAGTCCVSRPPTPATLPHESTCTPSKQVQHGCCGTDSSPHRCRQVANSTEYGGTATADKAWTYPCLPIGDRAFAVAASRACNTLPTLLKLMPSTNNFRRQLKKIFLLRVCLYGHRDTD